MNDKKGEIVEDELKMKDEDENEFYADLTCMKCKAIYVW